jgi:hypothetical protein
MTSGPPCDPTDAEGSFHGGKEAGGDKSDHFRLSTAEVKNDEAISPLPNASAGLGA